jgi:hypothetical protein
MRRSEDLNAKFFKVTDERFSTQQKPSLLIAGTWSQSHAHSFNVFGHTDTSGALSLFLQQRTISSKLLEKSVNCVCKEPTLYQSEHKNVSESQPHFLFPQKTIQLSSFAQHWTAHCPPFHKLVCVLTAMANSGLRCHLSNFHELQHSLTVGTSILQYYSFNAIIKWYDIPCAILYLQ